MTQLSTLTDQKNDSESLDNDADAKRRIFLALKADVGEHLWLEINDLLFTKNGRNFPNLEAALRAHKSPTDISSSACEGNPQQLNDPCVVGESSSSPPAPAPELQAADPSALKALEEERDKFKRMATDRQYMIEAIVPMLGPKGRDVWDGWQKSGVQRVHYTWGPEGAKTSGEERAQLHLELSANLKNAPPTNFEDAT